MSITLKINRSDRYPVGQLVKAYPSAARHTAGPPGAASVAEATVGAAGTLEITVAAKTELTLYAEVAGEHRYLRIGDPARDVVGTLKERIAQRRTLAGA